MNSYDKAYELAKTLNSDPAVKDFKDVKKRVEATKELFDKIENFKKERLELQINSIQNGSVDKEQEEKVKKDYQELLAEPLAVEYFEKEVKMNILVSDIQKIIYEDIKDIL